MSSLSIVQVARRAGVSIEAVRFYECEGLLDEPPRRASGCRQYSEEAIKGIRFVKRTRQLGFSFEEISDLLTLCVAGQTSCEQIKKRIKAKLASVERKMVELERIRRALKWIGSLHRGRPGQCLSHADALNQQEQIEQQVQEYWAGA